MDKRSSNLGKHTGRTHGETWDNLKKTTKTSSMHNFFSGKKAHKQSKHVCMLKQHFVVQLYNISSS